MILAYDSLRPDQIPKDAPAVFPYGDGDGAWARTWFPKARYRYITRQGDPHLDICDFEPGCVWPVSSVVGWAHARRALHRPDLTVYTDRANFDLVYDAMRAAGLSWHLWLATLDGTKVTEWQGMHVRACQYETEPEGRFDVSEVYDEWWLNKP